jgi:membrane fusion protein (multidrug efflux system)
MSIAEPVTSQFVAPAVPGEPPFSLAASVRRLAIPAVAIALVIGLVVVSDHQWGEWVSAAAIQSTDDAYVQADVSTLSARVSGNVLRVLVNDFQPVKAGQLLVQIDPADYQAAVKAAEAAVAGARAALDNLANQEALQRALLQQAKAQHDSALASQTVTQQERDRQQTLLNGGIAGTQQKVQQANAAYSEAMAGVAASAAAIEAQQRQLDVLIGQEGTLRANLDAAQANLTSAQLKLGYTSVVAPFDGEASTRAVQPSDYVNVGTNLISVVPVPNVYVIANFKETQLTHAAAGQPVDLTIDTFPGQTLRGHVGRLSPASGAVFALLPPDNATGNFTKVVQRIPVRIEIDPGQPLTDKLRAGMSVEASIHVDDKR